MATVGTLASGAMQNLIHRAASVALKEGRKLVLVPRETPLSSIHLRGLATLNEAGAVILFAAPGFYHGAETIDDLVDFVVARCLDQLGLDNALVKRWGERMTLRDRDARARRRCAAMFDRIAPVYDAMNRVMTAGLDQRWRRLAVERGRLARRPRARRVLRHRRPRGRGRAARRARRRARLLAERCSSARGASRARSSGCRATRSRCPFADGELRRRDGRLRRAQPRRPRGRAARAARACCGRAAGSRSSRSRGRAGILRPFFRLWFDVLVPLRGQGAPGRRRPTRTCRRACAASPARRTSPRCSSAPASRTSATACSAAGSSRCTRGRGAGDRARDRPRGARARRRTSPSSRSGSRRAVDALPGPRRRGRGEALAAGGKRLRPLLAFLSSPPDDDAARRRRRRGRARAHGDARPRRPDRRRRAPARPRGGLERARRRTRRRRPATTSSRARSPSSPRRGDAAAVAVLADASLALARGEALQRAPAPRPRHDRRGLPRALRAQDREAVRGGVRARRAAERRVRARARHRLPDRRRHPRLRGRDDRDRQGRRAPTCATARRRCRSCSPRARTTVVRDALAGGPLEGALVRVAATRRARAVPRAGARLRFAGPGLPRRRAAPGRARGARPTPSWRGGS